MASDPCEGDNGITYRKDGTWDIYSEGGKWTLTRASLITLTTYRGEPDEQQVRLKKPKRQAITIISLSKNAMTQRWSNGSVRRFHRCR